MLSHLFWLTDAQMARLLPFFLTRHGKPGADDRRDMCGIIFINRNGLRLWIAPGNMARQRRSATVGKRRVKQALPTVRQ